MEEKSNFEFMYRVKKKKIFLHLIKQKKMPIHTHQHDFTMTIYEIR